MTAKNVRRFCATLVAIGCAGTGLAAALTTDRAAEAPLWIIAAVLAWRK